MESGVVGGQIPLLKGEQYCVLTANRNVGSAQKWGMEAVIKQCTLPSQVTGIGISNSATSYTGSDMDCQLALQYQQ